MGGQPLAEGHHRLLALAGDGLVGKQLGDPPRMEPHPDAGDVLALALVGNGYLARLIGKHRRPNDVPFMASEHDL